jgi:hypothetical protein
MEGSARGMWSGDILCDLFMSLRVYSVTSSGLDASRFPAFCLPQFLQWEVDFGRTGFG